MVDNIAKTADNVHLLFVFYYPEKENFMKKTIFTALIVLLALLAVTCDNVVTPAKSPGALPGGEPEFVTVSIGVSDGRRARAMTLTNADNDIDFYEVVFMTPTTVIRDTANLVGGTLSPDPWTVDVPIGNYRNNINKAVLFAGKEDTTSTPGNEQHTLLAIGEITSNPNITLGSTITFTLYAIRSGVNEDANDSYFKITKPYTSQTKTSPTDPDYLEPEMVDVFGDTIEYPAFIIPHMTDSPGITATYEFNVQSEDFVKISGPPSVQPLTGVPEITAVLDGISITGSDWTVFPRNFQSGGFFTLTISTKTLPFDETAGADNLAAFSILVPVRALTMDPTTGGSDTGQPWYIKGGSDNENLDDGAGTGGAVLLKITGKTGAIIEAEIESP